MTYQAGSTWEVTRAIVNALDSNLQAHVDAESDRLAEVYGELQGDDYEGDAVKLRIPDVVSVSSKFDVQAGIHPASSPAVFVGTGGTTSFTDAVAMTGRQGFAETTVQIAGYVTVRALYQGTIYRLTEDELGAVSKALGGAILSTMRAGGLNSVWQSQAGIINPEPISITVNGYKTADDETTTAAKVLITFRMGHEMRL